MEARISSNRNSPSRISHAVSVPQAFARPAAPLSGALPGPLWHQIYTVLREQLTQRHEDGTSALPGELDLAARFGVSRVTMRRALDELKREGLIERSRGRGSFARASRVQPMAVGVSGLLENLVKMGLKSRVRVVSLESLEATPDVAQALGIAPGAVVVKGVRVRSVDAGPIALITTFVPQAFAKPLTRRALAARPMLTLLEESGVDVARAQQTLSARLADATTAPLLEVQLGAALIAVHRVVKDAQGSPVQLLRGLYRPDRYEYQMELSRVGGDNKVWVSEPGPANSTSSTKESKHSPRATKASARSKPRRARSTV
jgi:GntR family transcriptional regulator